MPQFGGTARRGWSLALASALVGAGIAGFISPVRSTAGMESSGLVSAGDLHGDRRMASQQPEFDGEMMALARQIPGFGGAYLAHRAPLNPHPDPRGPFTVHVRLTPQGDSTQATEIARRHFTEAGYIVEEIRIVASTYTFEQLRQWRDALAPLLRTTVAGTISLDADEATNRVTVGVETAAGATAVDGVLGAAGVPRQAVNVLVRGPIIREQSTLQDQFRPIPAGVYIALSQPTGLAQCTLGVNVTRDNAQRFWTASHCSGAAFEKDTFSFRQPNSGSAIGREYLDPPFQTSTSCPYAGYPCRWSDAALVTYTSSGLPEFARVAATTNQTGSISIDLNRPRLRIIGERTTYYVGDIVDKIGAFGGWTYNNITATCAHQVNYVPGKDLACLGEAAYESQGGDSGAPIIIWYLDDRAEIAGLHAGKYQATSTRFFSKWDGIVRDFGSAGTAF